MNYTPSKPDWFYSYVHIENLEKIQQELLFVRENISPGAQFQSYYVNYFRKDIEEYIPSLCDYLKTVSLYDKFFRIVLSSKKKPGEDLKSGIHVDQITKRFIYSLNIPVLDCENTYTAWYKGEVELFDQTNNPYIRTNHNRTNHFGVVNEQNATEICRVETIRPMLINTTIPHRALTNKATRIIACIRFVPDITDEEILRLIQ
jgi:hypothetical protein